MASRVVPSAEVAAVGIVPAVVAVEPVAAADGDALADPEALEVAGVLAVAPVPDDVVLLVPDDVVPPVPEVELVELAPQFGVPVVSRVLDGGGGTAPDVTICMVRFVPARSGEVALEVLLPVVAVPLPLLVAAAVSLALLVVPVVPVALLVVPAEPGVPEATAVQETVLDAAGGGIADDPVPVALGDATALLLGRAEALVLGNADALADGTPLAEADADEDVWAVAVSGAAASIRGSAKAAGRNFRNMRFFSPLV